MISDTSNSTLGADNLAKILLKDELSKLIAAAMQLPEGTIIVPAEAAGIFSDARHDS